MRNRLRRLLSRLKSSRVVANPANAYTTGVYDTCQYYHANAYTTGVYDTCQYS